MRSAWRRATRRICRRQTNYSRRPSGWRRGRGSPRAGQMRKGGRDAPARQVVPARRLRFRRVRDVAFLRLGLAGMIAKARGQLVDQPRQLQRRRGCRQGRAGLRQAFRPPGGQPDSGRKPAGIKAGPVCHEKPRQVCRPRAGRPWRRMSRRLPSTRKTDRHSCRHPRSAAAICAQRSPISPRQPSVGPSLARPAWTRC